MAIKNGNNKKISEFKNLNLTPLLDFVVAVIPVLLLSVNFLEYVVLDTSLPVFTDEAAIQSKRENQEKLGLSVAITDAGFVIAGQGGLLNQGGQGTLIKRTTGGAYDYTELGNRLLEIKSKYPEEWTVIIIPEASTKFDDIVTTMDISREHLATNNRGELTRKVMFPNVVIGGGVI
ncbi:MAG: biopolymer transporter ExbD [bacterium]